MYPILFENTSQHYRQLTPILGSISYSIKPGDNLYHIAQKFNTTVSNILKFNYIPTPELIYAGKVLTIPLSPPEAIIYTVQRGDTLYSIAQKFGTYVKNLIDFNYLTNANLIFPGQRLVVTASLK